MPVASEPGSVNLSWDAADGLAVAVIRNPVVRAEFTSGTNTAAAQILRFNRYPDWQLLDARLPWSTRRGITVRGWMRPAN